MEKYIKGLKYNYEIETIISGNLCVFSLRAIDKITGRYSGINNLNIVLSELDIDIEDERFEDSFGWELSKREAQLLSKDFTELLNDKIYLKDYLEPFLDEDRKCGEWANILTKKS